MKVAIISSKKRWFLPSMLTKLFTGCRAYHVGFYSESSGNFFDMDMMRRRIPWRKYFNHSRMKVDFFPCKVDERYLNLQVLNNNERYGIADYFLFAFRWLGFKFRNREGIICSEMVNMDLSRVETTPWPIGKQPPSPCDILEWCNGNRQKNIK